MAEREGHVDALWVGPYGHRLADGTLLETDITVCEIGVHEAVASDNWKPQNLAQAKKLIAKAEAAEGSEPPAEPEPEPTNDDGGDA